MNNNPAHTARSFFRSLSGLMQNRELIRMFTIDELRRHYVGSAMGLYWLLVKPLFVICLYGVLFGVIFRSRGGPTQTWMEYLLLLLTGLLPWLIFSEALTAATTAITSNVGLVTKVLFPIEILPVTKVLGAMLSGLVTLFLFVLVLASMQQAGWTLLLLPLLILLQLAFTLGLGWILSAVNVAVRDTSQALPFALTLWMFLSPVVYSKEMVPKALAVVFLVNPISYFIDGYRSILLTNQPPTFHMWFVVVLVAVATFLSGFWVFSKMRINVADFI